MKFSPNIAIAIVRLHGVSPPQFSLIRADITELVARTKIWGGVEGRNITCVIGRFQGYRRCSIREERLGYVVKIKRRCNINSAMSHWYWQGGCIVPFYQKSKSVLCINYYFSVLMQSSLKGLWRMTSQTIFWYVLEEKIPRAAPLFPNWNSM